VTVAGGDGEELYLM
jgi:hypothetical protein